MSTYLMLTLTVEYIYVQWMYSHIQKSLSYSLFIYPLKSCIQGFLLKANIYASICIFIEIYTYLQVDNTKTYFIFMFVLSFIMFCISLLYNILDFIKMLIGKQPRTALNPLYSNTANLAFISNFRSVYNFVEKFSIQNFGKLFLNINFKQERAIIKLIFEWMPITWVQILFIIQHQS